jgi:hypothetical protein
MDKMFKSIRCRQKVFSSIGDWLKSFTKSLNTQLLVAVVFALSLTFGTSVQSLLAHEKAQSILVNSSTTLSNSSNISNSKFVNSVQAAGTTAYIVAASDATALEKAGANISCDGTADEVEIQSAIASNRNIMLSSGTFYVTNLINLASVSNITISGTAGTRISRNSANRIFRVYSSSDVTIQGLEMYCTDTQGIDMVLIKASTEVRIQNNVFHDFNNAIMISCDPVSHNKSSQVQVVNNEFYNYHYCCIDVENGSQYVDINDNTMHDGTNIAGGYLYAINTSAAGGYDTVSPLVEWINIKRNHIYNQNYHNAIDVHGGNHIQIVGNQIENVFEKGIYAHFIRKAGFAGVTENQDWIISGNTITNVSYGICVDSGETNATLSNIVIDSNTIKNWNYRGIDVETSGCVVTDVNIINNTVSGHSGDYKYGYGIVPVGIQNVKIKENTVLNKGDTLDAEVGVYAIRCVNAVVESNIVGNGGSTGIAVKGCHRFIVTNNTTANCPNGIYLVD